MKEARGRGGALASPPNTELARKSERVQRAGIEGKLPKQGSVRKEPSTSQVWPSLVLGRGSKVGVWGRGLAQHRCLVQQTDRVAEFLAGAVFSANTSVSLSKGHIPNH